MKICIVCGGFPPDKYGGVENSLASFKEGMERRGHEVCVIAQDFRGKKEFGKNVHWLDVELQNSLPKNRVLQNILDAWQFGLWYLKVRNFLRTQEFDIYHGHQIWGFVACLAKDGNWVLTPRNVIAPTKEWMKPLAHKGHYLILKRALAKAGRVVAISRVLEENIALHSPQSREKTRLIYNGIDLDFFSRGKPNKKSGKKRLLFVGRMKPEKGPEDVLRAYSILKERGADVGLTVAGVGGLLQKLKGEYADAEFLGFVPRERLVEEYRRADIYITYAPKAITDESFCNSLVEAMACECAVVCSDIPVYREVTKGKAFFAEPENPEKLADAVEKALARSDLERIGKSMRKVAENYSLEKNLDMHEQLYREIIGGAKK